jgi:outer membrane lipoprotein-sorting protein
MKRTSILFVLSCLFLAGLFFANTVSAADNVTADEMSVDEVIAKFIEARGGREAWDKVKTAKMTGVVSMPSQGMEIPIRIEIKRPGMVRFQMTIQGMDMIQAYDGTTGWAIMPMMGKPDAEEMADDQLKQILDQSDFDGALVDYADKGHSVELLGKEDVEGTDAYKLKITKKNGDIITTYIDTENFIEFRQESKQDMQGVEVDAATVFGDYKEVDGILLPHSMEVSMGGPVMQIITISEVELNADISDDRFAMPAKTEPAEAEESSEGTSE